MSYSLFAGQVQTSARAASERTSIRAIWEDLWYFGIWQLTSLYNYFYITSSAELCTYFYYQILKYSLFAEQVQTSARAASERTSISLIRERPLFFAIWQLRLLYNCCYITSKTELCSNLRYSLFAGQVHQREPLRSAPPPG